MTESAPLADIKKKTNIEKQAKKLGIRMTEQRRIIAEVLCNSTDHPDIETLHSQAIVADPRISVSTIYRTVKLFEDCGLITRHGFMDGKSRYEVNPEIHHDHLIDVRTGKVLEFRDKDIELLQEKIALKLGYKLVDHKLELYGVPIDS